MNLEKLLSTNLQVGFRMKTWNITWILPSNCAALWFKQIDYMCLRHSNIIWWGPIATCKQISLGESTTDLCQFAVSYLDSLVCLCLESQAKMSASATSTATNLKNSLPFCWEKQLAQKSQNSHYIWYIIYHHHPEIYLSPGKHWSSVWCSLPTSKVAATSSL